MKAKDLPHYFICWICAVGRGGVSSEGTCTVHKDVCPYCSTESILYAWNDFNWPKDKTMDFKAKLERD